MSDLSHIYSKVEKIKFFCGAKLNKGLQLRPKLTDQLMIS